MLDFRVLRENRRVCIDEARARELETFHSALGDVALGHPTERVKELVVEAYVRGAHVGCAERAEVEGSTSVFTKRRYRDKWNRSIVIVCVAFVRVRTCAVHTQPLLFNASLT